MRRMPRGPWPVVTVLVVAAIAALLLYAVWRSPNRIDLATFGGYAAGVATIASGIVSRVWRARAEQKAGGPTVSGLDRSSDLLARAVRDPWTRAATDRGGVVGGRHPV